MTAIDKLKFIKAINGIDEMVRKDISTYPLYLLGMAYVFDKFDEIERKEKENVDDSKTV